MTKFSERYKINNIFEFKWRAVTGWFDSGGFKMMLRNISKKHRNSKSTVTTQCVFFRRNVWFL